MRLEEWLCVVKWSKEGDGWKGCYEIEIVDEDGERVALPFRFAWPKPETPEKVLQKDFVRDERRDWDVDMEKGLLGLDGLCLASRWVGGGGYDTFKGLFTLFSQAKRKANFFADRTNKKTAIEEECHVETGRESRSMLSDTAFLIAFFIGCVLNLSMGVYAAVHDWDMSRVALHLMVTNPMIVCVGWMVCEIVERWMKRGGVRMA